MPSKHEPDYPIIPDVGPLISLVIAIWMIVIGVIAVREVLDYSNTGRAIIVLPDCHVRGVVRDVADSDAAV